MFEKIPACYDSRSFVREESWDWDGRRFLWIVDVAAPIAMLGFDAVSPVVGSVYGEVVARIL